MLELAFATKELRSVCEDSALALKEYGPEVADALWARLSDLRAATHPLELPFASLHTAAEGDAPFIAIELADGWSLVLTANHRRLPISPDGKIAWERISRVLIIRLDHSRG